MDIIVPTRNYERTIEACLRSLRQQTIPCRIIMVDGYSTDNTVSLAKKHLRKTIDLICNEPITKNKRRSPEARNEGLRHSNSGRVAFIDADAVAPATWLEDSLKYFEDLNVASVTSGSKHGNTSRLGFAIFRVMQLGSTHARSFSKVEEIDSTPGYNAVYRRKAIDEVGGFAELGGAEDWELNWRLRRAGWIILGIPEKPMIHYERSSLKGFFKQMEHNGWTKSMLLKKRHIFTLKFALPPLAAATALIICLADPRLIPLVAVAAIAGEGALALKVHGGFEEAGLFAIMHIAWTIGYLEGMLS